MKICNKCGYVLSSSSKELKCPICGGLLTSKFETDDTGCDPVEEREWNSGYHNDFEEGRKTGEYCDPRFEKYANGGEHYHGTQKETYNEEESYNEEVSYNRKTVPNQPADISELPHAALTFIVLIIGLCFPIFGPILLMVAVNKNPMVNEEGARRIKKLSKICIAITIAFFVLQAVFGLVIENFVP